MFMLGGCSTVNLWWYWWKVHYLAGYSPFANVFFPGIFSQVTQRHAITFVKSVKEISIFSETFEGQEILRRKTNKSYDKTFIQNDPGNNTKKNCKLDSENYHA